MTRGGDEDPREGVAGPATPSGAEGAFDCVAFALVLAVSWCADLVVAAPSALPPAVSLYMPGILRTVVFLACAFLAPRLGPVLQRRGTVLAAGVVFSAGQVLALLGGWMPCGTVATSCGLVVSSIAEPVLLLMLLDRFAHLEPHRSFLLVPAAYLLDSLVYFLLRAVDPRVATVVVCALPVVAVALMVAEVGRPRRAAGGPDDDAGTVAGVATVRVLDGDAPADLSLPGTDRRAGAARPVSWTFPVYPVVLIFIYKFVFYCSLSLTDGPSMYGPLGIALICLVALVGGALLFDRYRPTLLYRLALPLMVAGLLMVAWLDAGAVASTMLTNASNIAFEMFLLLTLCEICYRYDIEAIWMFGIVEGFASLAASLGWLAGRSFTAVWPAGTSGADVAVTVVIVALIASSVLFFDDRMVSRTFGTAPHVEPGGEGTPSPAPVLSYYEDLVWRCQRVARRYGLTHREEEILELLAQGMSTARIEETLCISQATAKTHAHHVYEKLGVHSRDEARALVDAQR